ncbi:MAG: hypothetical protein US86_C0001G0282 [Candidatus Daviesbacteria bacterium GW2011_GWA2_38_24]|uniref:Sortase family protein n=1 Tax=Candidatus Daviesbacteria bacterium GW2011_GWA2_38_24 TaxID=1618422 RepID=A0A0G0JW66_9BACT|nr:MAG: hypothetical protein US86_C0001G0282 [Candidatus Daviesbacteria bacterium GW2011_GWA2_38_24]KKQ78644.1 MAG: hypothetical protein UT01_C0064G0016 [Candidatus Daviesbacteria bacterium GW2011_GWA1_38_7]
MLGNILFTNNVETSNPGYQKLQEKAVKEYSLPQKIAIPKINLTVSITEGGIKDNGWILSKTEVMYVPTSGKLGEGFNTVLYAHKRKGLFLHLNKLQKWDRIVVYDSQNKEYNFEVFSKEVVKPIEVERIKTNEENTLTLFTCDGWLDKSRLVVKAKMI